MGRKMFVVGRLQTTSCEVFDSCSRKFINITSEMKTLQKNYFGAFFIGFDIVIFHYSEVLKPFIHVYDINELSWSTVDYLPTIDYFTPRCVKYYVQQKKTFA